MIHSFILGTLLQPAHRSRHAHVVQGLGDAAIVWSRAGPRGTVEVAVDRPNCAVLFLPLQVQHHPHLAPGEGGAGVLFATTLVQAFTFAGLLASTPLVMLAVGLVSAPHHL